MQARPEPGCSQNVLKPHPSRVLLGPSWVAVCHHCRQVSAQSFPRRELTGLLCFSALGGSIDKTPSSPLSVVAGSQGYDAGQGITCVPAAHLPLHPPPAVQASLASETHLNWGRFLFPLPDCQWSGSLPGQSQPSPRASLPVHDEEVRQHEREQKGPFVCASRGDAPDCTVLAAEAAAPGCGQCHSPGAMEEKESSWASSQWVPSFVSSVSLSSCL